MEPPKSGFGKPRHDSKRMDLLVPIRSAEADPEALEKVLSWHGMLLFAPRNQLAIHKTQIDKLTRIARHGRRVEQGDCDVVAVWAAGVAPYFGVLILIGDDVGQPELLAHLGHCLAGLERVHHPMSTDFGGSLIGGAASGERRIQ